MNVLTLKLNSKEMPFQNVYLDFKGIIESNVFAQKNNKTLRETLLHPKYKFLENRCEHDLRGFLDTPLGEALLVNKQNKKETYKRFLNPYGDLSYSQFSIQDSNVLNLKGLYAYVVNQELVYIGRCLDTFKKRINYGYGKIAPKNCYRDGQSTNCHLNALITEERKTKDIRFYVMPLNNLDVIKHLEVSLIQKYNPLWNKQLKTKNELPSALIVTKEYRPTPKRIDSSKATKTKSATFQKYVISQLESGAIEIREEEQKLSKVLPTLREIAGELTISINNSNGNPYNTRQLGAILIEKLSTTANGY